MSLGSQNFLKLLLLAIFFVVFSMNTQGVLAVSPSSILVNVAPENPAPGETVTITLNSYAADLDSTPITWSTGGKTSLSGIGKKIFSLTAPAAGAEVNVVAAVNLPDGVIQKNIIIRPAVMALLWQATDSYVPPFYKGKALPTPDSEVKVVAMPEIKTGTINTNAKNMVYSWKKDYTNDLNNSGYGKNSYSFVIDYLDDSNVIAVTASTTDQKYSAQSNIVVKAVEPKVVFYERNSSLGTYWEKALGNDHIIANDIVLQAAPYYISPNDVRMPSLEWIWSINNLFVSPSEVWPNILPLKVQPGMSGTSIVKVKINNKYKIFENAEGQLNIKF